VTLPFKISCASALYDGSEGQGLTFDHSGLPTDYDAYQVQPVGKTDVIALLLAKFDATLSESPTNYHNDTMIIAGSNYTVSQHQFTFQGINRWVCHSEGFLGGVIPGGTEWVVIGIHHNSTGEYGEMYVQDATTGNLLGASRSTHLTPASTLSYIRLTDYLRLADQGPGSVKVKLFALRSTDQTFPPYTIPIPTPLAIAHSRTGANEQTVTWNSPCQIFQVERNKNSGGWATLDAAFEYKSASPKIYEDTDLVDGDTVQYRVAAKIGSQSSAIATSVAGVVA